MSKEISQLQCVYVVMCYNNIVGVYAAQEDAALCQRDQINKNRPADILCRAVIYPNIQNS